MNNIENIKFEDLALEPMNTESVFNKVDSKETFFNSAVLIRTNEEVVANPFRTNLYK